MNDSHLVSIARVEAFIKGAEEAEVSFQGKSRDEKYVWIKQTLTKFYDSNRNHFPQKYTVDDIALLIETDKAHDRLSGPATKTILERMYNVFKDLRFSRLCNISVSHIYNLRGRRQYLSQAHFFEKTKPVKVNIGERRKPYPDGKPGFIRVDTVHQGDLEKEKGVYHINCVDEVTQWEIVGSAEKISEHFLEPLLASLIAQFPFRILGFHSDNGSEYVNKIVAKLLTKLLVEQTRSRSRHCNDNALVEGKNGSVVRKHMGYVHIPQRYASAINHFCRDHLNVYLNYHRPCGFATIRIDTRGKEKKTYRQEDYMTPYEKLKSLPNVHRYLKAGIDFGQLDRIANEKSDNEYAALTKKAKVELFKQFHQQKLQLPTIYTYAILGSSVD